MRSRNQANPKDIKLTAIPASAPLHTQIEETLDPLRSFERMFGPVIEYTKQQPY
jgi:hypothetical protein